MKKEQSIKEVATATVNGLTGIVLPEKSNVVRKTGILNTVKKTSTGFELLLESGTKIITNKRSMLYLGNKSSSGKKAFEQWKKFYEEEPAGTVKKPSYSFPIWVLCEEISGVGFSHSLKPLYPLNAKLFTEIVETKQFKEFSIVPFNLGATTYETVEINFGCYNGNSGISYKLPNGISLKAKHLPNSIHAMVNTIKAQIKAIAKATTEKEAIAILEGFKGTTL